jgi:Lyase.
LANKGLGRLVHLSGYVDLGQPSNYAVPTAIGVATAAEAEEELLQALRRLV